VIKKRAHKIPREKEWGTRPEKRAMGIRGGTFAVFEGKEEGEGRAVDYQKVRKIPLSSRFSRNRGKRKGEPFSLAGASYEKNRRILTMRKPKRAKGKTALFLRTRAEDRKKRRKNPLLPKGGGGDLVAFQSTNSILLSQRKREDLEC